MKRIIFLLVVVVLFSPSAKSQKRNLTRPFFSHTFTMNTLFHTSPEVSLQFEKHFNFRYSIQGSIGVKRHDLPDYFNFSEHTNYYVFEKSESITWIVFIPIPGNTGRYIDGTKPLDTLGNFVPASSFPLKIGGRRYFGKPNGRMSFFMGLGMLFNFHKGFSIKDKTLLLYQEQIETISGIPFFAGETATVTISNYEQTRTITSVDKLTLGFNFSSGLRWRFSDRLSMVLMLETGGNLINNNPYWKYYGIQPAYIYGQVGGSFSF